MCTLPPCTLPKVNGWLDDIQSQQLLDDCLLVTSWEIPPVDKRLQFWKACRAWKFHFPCELWLLRWTPVLRIPCSALLEEPPSPQTASLQTAQTGHMSQQWHVAIKRSSFSMRNSTISSSSVPSPAEEQLSPRQEDGSNRADDFVYESSCSLATKQYQMGRQVVMDV